VLTQDKSQLDDPELCKAAKRAGLHRIAFSQAGVATPLLPDRHDRRSQRKLARLVRRHDPPPGGRTAPRPRRRRGPGTREPGRDLVLRLPGVVAHEPDERVVGAARQLGRWRREVVLELGGRVAHGSPDVSDAPTGHAAGREPEHCASDGAPRTAAGPLRGDASTGPT